MQKIWFDGKLVAHGKAQIHVLNHTLHYGSGVFEGIRAYETTRGAAIFRLREHVDRLFYSATCMGMKVPYSKKEITHAIVETVRANKLRSCYIRPLIFYGEKMGLYPGGSTVHVVIAAWAWGSYLGEKPVKTVISPFQRLAAKSFIPDAKVTGYYMNSILASLDAKKRKADEAILLDSDGYIAEGPGENIFMVEKGKVYTPKSGSILPGITRATVMQLLKDIKISVTEARITPARLKKADEVFFVGTAAEITPVGRIDQTAISGGWVGPITAQVRSHYLAAVSGREPRYTKWLTYVSKT